MSKRLLAVVLVLVLGVAVFAVACGGSETTTTTAAPATSTSAASGEAIKIGFDEGFTGFMSYDCQLADQGVKTALAMLNNQWEGRPLKYFAEDNGSDPVVAVDKARKLVESDKIDVMIGPIFSPSAKSVADYLAKSSGIPQISIVGQPTENLETANGLAFVHTGFFDSHGYYFGKYLAEKGYKTANVINYDDTPAYALTAGFEKAFVEEGGGQILSKNYVPLDVVDFSSYLSAMKPADVTVNWIFGNGAVPFVKQLKDYGIKGVVAVPMSNNFSDAQIAELGDVALGMIACDYYAWTLENAANTAFIEAYGKLYKGEKPTPQAYGAWQGVMMYLEALKATGGDKDPKKIIPELAKLTMDGPAGKFTVVPFQSAYIAQRDFFILEVQKVGDVLTWVPVKTYEQVTLGDLSTVAK